MSRKQMLRSLVNERLTAAVGELFGVFERTIEEYEAEIDRQQKLLDAMKPEIRTDSLPTQLIVCEEEVHPEQQERSPSLIQGLEQPEPILELTLCSDSVKCQHDGEKTQSSQLSPTQDPELLQIKEEQEELSQDLEEADGFKTTLHPVKYEHYGENTLYSHLSQTQDPELLQIKDELLQGLEEADCSRITQPFQLLQTQREKNREAYCLPSTSNEQMETEPDGDDCGVSDPASNLEPGRDVQFLSSDCFGTVTVNRDDDWKETGQSQSGLKMLKSKNSQKIQSFSNSWTLNRSMESSHELKSSSHILSTPCCKVCGKYFPNKMSLMLHIQVVHSSDNQVYGKHLDTTEGLKLHFETHRICTNNIDIERHMRAHIGDKSFLCSVCGKGFSDKWALKSHMRSHTGEKPFSCSVCGKTFTQKGTVKIHMRSHTGEKPFSCSICRKRFTQNGTLTAHMRLHTGESPYLCTVCGKGFPLSLYLKRHKCHPPL